MIDGFLIATILLATPTLLAALGELLVERTGVLNIGLEGVMLTGALAAAVAADSTGSPLAGVAAGAAVGSATSLVFGAFALGMRADQVLVGTAVNLVAFGATGGLYRALYGSTGTALVLPTLPALGAGPLADVPILGPVVAGQTILGWLAVLATVGLTFVLRYTGLGLRLRALGERPTAATALGVPVLRLRLGALAVAGALGGVGGAALCLVSSSTFVEGITAGRGFIALAIVVVGRWTPLGVLGGALLFGMASALQYQFQAAAWAVPYQVFLALPYAVTLAVLGVTAGKSRAPRALGAAVTDQA